MSFWTEEVGVWEDSVESTLSTLLFCILMRQAGARIMQVSRWQMGYCMDESKKENIKFSYFWTMMYGWQGLVTDLSNMDQLLKVMSLWNGGGCFSSPVLDAYPKCDMDTLIITEETITRIFACVWRRRQICLVQLKVEKFVNYSWKEEKELEIVLQTGEGKYEALQFCCSWIYGLCIMLDTVQIVSIPLVCAYIYESGGDWHERYRDLC